MFENDDDLYFKGRKDGFNYCLEKVIKFLEKEKVNIEILSKIKNPNFIYSNFDT